MLRTVSFGLVRIIYIEDIPRLPSLPPKSGGANPRGHMSANRQPCNSIKPLGVRRFSIVSMNLSRRSTNFVNEKNLLSM